jgi:hypothetical protein
VEGQAVGKAVDGFAKKFKRFDEAFDALKWLLARKCATLEYISKKVGSTTYCLYRQASDQYAATPSITVVYTYDENEVVLIDLTAEVATSESDQEDD